MRTTLKVAELATFIYAILVFGSMCIEMSYFSSFGISVAAYLRISEILIVFLNKPMMYIPLISTFILLYLSPELWFDNLGYSNFKNSYEAFSGFSLFIILINMFAILLAAYLYDVLYSVLILLCSICVVLLFVLPNTIKDKLSKNFKDMLDKYRNKALAREEHYLSVLNKPCKPQHAFRVKVNSYYKVSRYRKAKGRYRLIKGMSENSFLYGIVVSYTMVVIGLSIINLTRAGSYIDNESSPQTKATIVTNDCLYICDNVSYMHIAESEDYVFIYDRVCKESIVIPRSQIIKTTYLLDNKKVFSKKTLNERHEIADTTRLRITDIMN